MSSGFYLYFCVTLFFLQNLSKLKQWSMEGRAVHQVNNNWAVVKEKLKTTGVNSATKALIFHLISRYTNECTLAIDRTNAQCAPNHSHNLVISKDTNWCTLTPDHFNAPFVSKRLNGNNLSNGTFKPSILSKTTLPASFHKINIFCKKYFFVFSSTEHYL